jgi:mannose-1-phosphate guanylyltransferase
MPGAMVDPGATIDGGSSIGSGTRQARCLGPRGSVLTDDARNASGARVERGMIGRGAVIGAGTVTIAVIIGDGAVVGARCELRHGIRIWPGTEIGDGGVRFSAGA